MIYRPTYHTTIPADAKRFQKGGQEYAKFRLARTGELVTGLVMPSGKARIESHYWTARIRKNGKSVRVALGVKDKEAAMQLRAKLQLEADQQRAGTVDPYAKHRAKSLLQHLDDYEQHLESKGRCEKHISETIRTIRSVLTACRFRHSSDFNQEDLDRHLVALIKKGRSYRTRNMAMKSLRAMVTWMIRCHRLESDPFTMCESLNVAADPNRKRRRRALSPTDLGALIAAAEQGKVIRGVSGRQRALIYLTSAVTGLRRGELSKLQVADLYLDHDPPFIGLPAAIDKTRRGTTIPVHPVLAEKLREWCQHRSGHVFDLLTEGGNPKHTSRMMQVDCAAAGIGYTTDLGTADFHSHRSSFITQLCRSGADFSLVVKLARHSTPRLTSLVYDKEKLSDKAQVINQLAI